MSTQQPVELEATKADVTVDDCVDTTFTLGAVEKEAETDKAAEAAGQPAAVEAAEPEANELSETWDRKAEGQKFLEAFGERGGVWFAQGLSFQEAQELYVAGLEQKVEELQNKLAGVQPEGEAEPATYSEATPKQKPAIRIQGRKYD